MAYGYFYFFWFTMMTSSHLKAIPPNTCTAFSDAPTSNHPRSFLTPHLIAHVALPFNAFHLTPLSVWLSTFQCGKYNYMPNFIHLFFFHVIKDLLSSRNLLSKLNYHMNPNIFPYYIVIIRMKINKLDVVENGISKIHRLDGI